MAAFLDKNISNTTAYIKTKLDSVYRPADTMLQYIELFNMLRKTVGTNVAMPVAANTNVQQPSNTMASAHQQQQQYVM